MQAAEAKVAPAQKAASVAKKEAATSVAAHKAAKGKHLEAVYKKTRTNKHKKNAANNMKKVGTVLVD